jgi:hypothetical protein
MRIKSPPREFLDAKETVAARIAQGQPEPAAPRVLTLGAIELVPELFQQRRITDEEFQEHAQALAREIKEGPRGPRQANLAPITIFWIGDAWACVDGHHTFTAYRLVGRVPPVPVKALRGASLDEAIRASLTGNNKDKLRLSLRCRTEAAWRCTVEDVLSKANIASDTGVNESTIAAMRSAKRKFMLSNPSADCAEMTWAQMRLWKRPAIEGDQTDADVRAAEQLLRRTEKHLKAASARAIFLALGMHRTGLMAELLQMHEAHSAYEAYRADPFPYIASPQELHADF